MDLSNLHTRTVKGGLCLVAVYLLYILVTSLVIWNRRRAFRRAKGTRPAPHFPQFERIFGFGFLRPTIRAVKEHRLLDLMHQRYAEMSVNTYQITSLGRRLIHTREPENLKAILAGHPKKWNVNSNRKAEFGAFLGVGIFTVDGAQWQHSRSMLRPNFARSRIRVLASLESHVGHVVDAIKPDTTLDLSELFFRLTLDTATEFLLGESTQSLVKGDDDGFAAVFNDSQSFIAARLLCGGLAKRLVPGKAKFGRDTKFVQEFVDHLIRKALTKHAQSGNESDNDRMNRRYTFIVELLRHTTDRIRIRDELLNVLMAGRDTTASLLTNVWFILSIRPDVWQNLQADVHRLKGECPTFEQIKDLKYTKAVLNESLRLHPVVPLNSREATEDTTLPLGGGPNGRSPLFIKKGEVVEWDMYSMHRRKDFFGEDADVFRPERWLDDPETGRKGLRPGWEYLPFSGGPRVCIGQELALTEAAYTTIRLCQTFGGIESRCDKKMWQEYLTIGCVNRNGAKVALTSRK